MKWFNKLLFSAAAVTAVLFPLTAGAVPLIVPQGGTGVATFPSGELLLGAGGNPLTTQSVTNVVGGYISGSSSIPHVLGQAFGDVLLWSGTAWTRVATSSLGISGGGGGCTSFNCLTGLATTSQGGTGTTTIPSAGYVPVGNVDGTYWPTATSSLGLPTFASLLNYVTTDTVQTINALKSFTVKPTSSGDATTSDQLVNYGQVSALVTTGARFVDSSIVGTVTGVGLPANVYDNGTLGVGATLEGAINGALPPIDGVSLSIGQTILVKDESTQANNGYYDVTSLGSAGSKWLLTRHSTYDQQAEIVGGTFFSIAQGTTNIRKQYMMNNYNTITVGTTAITYGLLSASNVYTGSGGIALSGFDFFLNLLTTSLGGLGLDGSGKLQIKALGVITSMLNDLAVTTAKIDDLAVTGAKIANATIDLTTKVTGILPRANGGTGTSTTGSANQVLGNNAAGSGLEYKTIIAGANTTVINGVGSITIASTGGGGGGGASATTSFGANIGTIPFIASLSTNQPLGIAPTSTVDQEFGSTLAASSTISRRFQDMSRVEAYYLQAYQVGNGVTGQTMKLQCSTGGNNWADAGDSNGTLSIATAAPTPKATVFTNLSTACKSSVTLRLATNGGNGVANPSFRNINIIYRLTQPSAGATATSSQIMPFVAVTTAQALSNMVLASTTRSFAYFDSTNSTQFRLSKNQTVVGAAAARFNLQCSQDGTTYVDATSDGDRYLSAFATGTASTDWKSLTPTCTGNVRWQLQSQGGNGSADPAFTNIQVEFNTTQQVTGSAADFIQQTFNSLNTLTASTSINFLVKGLMTSFGSSTAPYFVATSTIASSTLQNTEVNQLKIGSLTGVLKAVGGFVTTALVNLTSDVTGTLPVANGGTGSTTLNGILKGNGTSQVGTAVGGTDYEFPLTFSTGLNRVGNTVTATNLTSPDFVKETNFGSLSLTASTTISLWSKGPIYASSTLTVQGDDFATTTVGDNINYFTFGRLDVGGLQAPLISCANNTGDNTCAVSGSLAVVENSSLNTDPSFNLFSSDLSVVGGMTLATSTGDLEIASQNDLNLEATNVLNVVGAATSTFNRGIDISGGCFAINGNCIAGGAGDSLWEYDGQFTKLSSSTAVHLEEPLFLTTADTFSTIAFGDAAFGNLANLSYAPSVKAFFLQDAAEFRITNGNFTLSQGLGSFGTTSVNSVLSATGSSTNAVDILSAFASTTGATLFTVDSHGMQYTGGDTPIVTGCGSSPSIVGNNNAGRVTVGSTGIGVTCTVTFADGGWQKTGNAPACALTAEGTNATPLNLSTMSQTQFATNVAATLSGATFSYQCTGF